MPVTGLLAGARGFGMFAAGPASDFVLIASQTVGSGGASSITFDNIPQGFRHLQLRGILKSSATISSSGAGIRLNSSSATYPRHDLVGNGTSAGSTNNVSGNTFAAIDGGADTANQFGAFIIDILDYTDTSKNTTIRTLFGMDNNGSGGVALVSALWINTAAVTSVTIYGNNIGSVVQHTSFSLYGVR